MGMQDNGDNDRNLLSEHCGMQDNGNDRESVYTDLDKTSLANVAPGEVTLWVHLISVYAISFFLYRVSVLHLPRAW